MKKLIVFMAMGCFQASAQELVVKPKEKVVTPVNGKGSITGTLAVGFPDYYRNNFSVPSGFEQGNTSGFLPIYARVEYGINEHVGLAATFGYEGLVYNYNQLHDSYNGIVRRYHADKFRLFSGGLAAYYHFTPLASVPRLHPFIGVGLALNNIRHSELPQGDSIVVTREHNISPVLKAGVRYFLSDQFSIYADAGYDKQSIVSIGFSCTFFRKNCETAAK